MSDARRAPRYTGVRTFAGLAQASLQAGPPLRAGPAAPGGEESPEGVGFDDAGNVFGSWTGKMMVRRWTKG